MIFLSSSSSPSRSCSSFFSPPIGEGVAAWWRDHNNLPKQKKTEKNHRRVQSTGSTSSSSSQPFRFCFRRENNVLFVCVSVCVCVCVRVCLPRPPETTAARKKNGKKVKTYRGSNISVPGVESSVQTPRRLSFDTRSHFLGLSCFFFHDLFEILAFSPDDTDSVAVLPSFTEFVGSISSFKLGSDHNFTEFCLLFGARLFGARTRTIFHRAVSQFCAAFIRREGKAGVHLSPWHSGAIDFGALSKQ